MENPLEIRDSSRGANSLAIEADYSFYTLLQLFKARYWVDTRSDSLEEEIQTRCAHIREQTNGNLHAAAGSASRFRPYGLIFGVIFLFFSVGPFVVFKLLDAITVINDVSGDIRSLSGVWALLTLPITVIIFMIGGMMDAERIVKWFNLAGRQNP